MRSCSGCLCLLQYLSQLRHIWALLVKSEQSRATAETFLQNCSVSVQTAVNLGCQLSRNCQYSHAKNYLTHAHLPSSLFPRLWSTNRTTYHLPPPGFHLGYLTLAFSSTLLDLGRKVKHEILDDTCFKCTRFVTEIICWMFKSTCTLFKFLYFYSFKSLALSFCKRRLTK